MPARGQGKCVVCKRPGSSRDALFTAPWRSDKTGEISLLTVHLGGCADALTATHTHITNGGTMGKTETATKPADRPAEHTTLSDDAEKVLDGTAGPLPAVPETPAEPDTEAADAELVDQAPPANIPAITSTDVMRYIRYNEPLPQFDSADVARAIALELLDASTMEDAMRSAEMMDIKDMMWRDLIIHGVKWQPSDKQQNPDAFPVYAVMDTTDTSTGQRGLVTCGGLNVVAIMIKADLSGGWPLKLKLTTVGTRSGNDTYKVESWGDGGKQEEPF